MAGSRRQGVTLLEMIVVITILAMLLGLAVLFMRNANRDLGVRAASHHVVALLRGAHQHARGTSSPAWVILNLRDNAVYMLYRETVGEWHFEDTDTTGAFGRTGVVKGGTLVKGRVGQGMQLAGSGTVTCGDVPYFARDQGIAIEFWFLRRRGGGRQVFCTVGKEVEIAGEGDGRVTARVGALQVTSGDVKVPLETWCHVQAIHGAGELKIFLNQVQVGARAGKAEWTRPVPLVIGDAKGGLNGVIDEFRVGLIIPRDLYYLPSEAKFVFPQGTPVPAAGEYVIAFDVEGRLDPARHAQPVRFKIKSPAEEKDIALGVGGTLLR
jgi:prepilin-type N-terminal cleavage/methylation domain-containing protein